MRKLKSVIFVSSLLSSLLFLSTSYAAATSALIIDHRHTDLRARTQSQYQKAKDVLHIGYGHTSHGSQITGGMSSLVNFINNGGLGLSSYPQNFFRWNNGGTGGALDLEDTYNSSWLDGDAGYYPQWVNETKDYLNDPDHSDVNVIMWSWCGQAASRTEALMLTTYLTPMSQLELDYPDITFVYMTGHADGSGESGNLHLRNQQIRDYAMANNKVLFDFYDIELYDPDGNYFGDKMVTDGCDYDSNGDGVRDANWAEEWQNSHTEGEDWYNSSSAHSQPLNANQKAYAAWALFAEIAERRASPVPLPGAITFFAPALLVLAGLARRTRP